MTTNYERIKQLTIDDWIEYADILQDDCLIRVLTKNYTQDLTEFCESHNPNRTVHFCSECFLRWLQSESEV